jgi:hydrogenase/urease accessory protein HupE
VGVFSGGRLLLLSALLLWASAAHPHVEQGQAAGFFAGVGHPVGWRAHVHPVLAV